MTLVAQPIKHVQMLKSTNYSKKGSAQKGPVHRKGPHKINPIMA